MQVGGPTKNKKFIGLPLHTDVLEIIFGKNFKFYVLNNKVLDWI